MRSIAAIFKRAYVKGIASAVLLTAGLAAGQAQADALTSGAASWDEVTADNSVIIADQATASTPKKGSQYFQDITVKSGGTFNNSGAETQLVVKGKFINEGTVNLNQGKTWGIVGYKLKNDPEQHLDTSEVAGTFENKKTLNISGSQLQMQTVILHSGSTTNVSGAMGNDPKWWDEAMIVADDLQVESGATVTMSGGQLVTGRGGTMNIAGTLTMTGNAFLRATDNYTNNGEISDPNSKAGKIVIAKTADITVSDQASGGIFANDVEVAGQITFESGSDFNLAGDLSYDSENGVADAAASAASTNIKVVGGTITVNSGATVAIGGTNQLNGEDVTSTLVVESGTLENNSTNVTVSANLQVADSADAKFTGSGSYQLTETGGLTMSSEKLTEFAKTGKVDASTAGATLTFTDTVDLSTLNIFGANGVQIGADTVLAGDGVTITGTLKDTDGNALAGYNGTIDQDDVEIIEPTTGAYNIAKVIAHNTMDIQGGADDTMTFSGTTLTLDRPYYQVNDNGTILTDSCGKQLENGTGRVTGDDIVLAQDTSAGKHSTLKAIAGHWVVTNGIDVNGGSIIAQEAAASQPVYLELNGDLTLTETNSYTFVQAAGANSTLDISKSQLTLANGSDKTQNLNASNGGVLVMKGDQVEQIISDATNKVSVKLEGSSTLKVIDSLDLKFADIVTGTGANKIRFDGADNTVDVAGTLTLTTGAKQKNTSTALNIGDNKLQAQSLVLENLDQTKSGDVWVNEEKVEVESGTLVALSNLTVRNDNLVLGSGSNSGALILGDSKLQSPYDATGTVSAKKITLTESSKLDSYGNWTQAGGEVDVTKGWFNVYGSYTADKLTIAGSDAGAYFHGVEDGQASSFTKVTAAGTDSLQVISGTLRIEGAEVKGEGSAANNTDPWGVNLANGTVKVDTGATLAFGNVASDHAFTVASDVVTLGKGFGTINLAGGTVELNFQDSFQNGLSAASLVDLKKKWLNGQGTAGEINGWLDINDTTISDLDTILTESEDGTYYTATQAEYAPIVDVLAGIKNEQVENLLLTEVKENVSTVLCVAMLTRPASLLMTTPS